MSKDKNPIRQHFTPQMLLKNFTDDKGLLHVFDTHHPENGIFSTSPKNVFLQRNYNTIYGKNGEGDYTVETGLSQLESSASKIIEKFIQSSQEKQVPDLTSAEKHNWDLFVRSLMVRNPRFRGDVWKIKDQFVEKYDQIAGETGSWDKMDIKEQERQLNNVLKSHPLDTEGPISKKRSYLLEVLCSKKISIAAIQDSKKSFVIGSDPVVLIGDHEQEIKQAWLPITHNILVGHCSKSGWYNITAKGIRDFNEDIFKQSQIVAGRSKELIVSLSRQYRKPKN